MTDQHLMKLPRSIVALRPHATKDELLKHEQDVHNIVEEACDEHMPRIEKVGLHHLPGSYYTRVSDLCLV